MDETTIAPPAASRRSHAALPVVPRSPPVGGKLFGVSLAPRAVDVAVPSGVEVVVAPVGVALAV
jgi:hypothetical protein